FTALLLEPMQAVVVTLSDDDVCEFVAVDICDDHGYAGLLVPEFFVKLPFIREWFGRRFDPSILHDEVSSSVPVNVADSQSMPVTAHNLYGIEPMLFCIESIHAERLPRGIRNDLHPTIPINIPRA